MLRIQTFEIIVMTSTADHLLTETGNPLPSDDLWKEASAEQLAAHELVRRQCEEQFSSSPLYQARVAKDPDYWKTYCPGGVHLLPKAT
jgi:hypothetical protein